jgi:hypothetical protein
MSCGRKTRHKLYFSVTFCSSIANNALKTHDMKKFAITMATSLIALSAIAGPVDKTTVPANAKWVLHLDMEAFRKTKVGGYLTDELLEKKLVAGKQKLQTNLSFSFTNLSSISAYGTRFNQPGEKEGILIIKTTADVKKDIDALTGLTVLTDEGKKITRVRETPYLLYNLNGDAFLAINPGNTLVVAKTKEEVESAQEVILKKKENLSKNETFAKLTSGDGAFFFLAAVQGLGEAPVPPQAQVLKETDGGRLLLGEDTDNVFLDLLLQGKSAEAAGKIQQIFQGLVALGSLNTEHKELSDLANATKVSADGQEVRVRLQYPVSKVIDKIQEKAPKHARL